jgi:hypothetical protein
VDANGTNGQTSGSIKPSIPAAATCIHVILPIPGNIKKLPGFSTTSPVPHTSHAGNPGPIPTGVGARVPTETGCSVGSGVTCGTGCGVTGARVEGGTKGAGVGGTDSGGPGGNVGKENGGVCFNTVGNGVGKVGNPIGDGVTIPVGSIIAGAFVTLADGAVGPDGFFAEGAEGADGFIPDGEEGLEGLFVGDLDLFDPIGLDAGCFCEDPIPLSDPILDDIVLVERKLARPPKSTPSKKRICWSTPLRLEGSKISFCMLDLVDEATLLGFEKTLDSVKNSSVRSWFPRIRLAFEAPTAIRSINN